MSVKLLDCALSRPIEEDAVRHQEKLLQALKGKLWQRVVTEEDILTKVVEGKPVKMTFQSLKSHTFRFVQQEEMQRAKFGKGKREQKDDSKEREGKAQAEQADEGEPSEEDLDEDIQGAPAEDLSEKAIAREKSKDEEPLDLFSSWQPKDISGALGGEEIEIEFDIREFWLDFVSNLGLPNLKAEGSDIKIKKSWNVESIERVGIRSLLDGRRTIIEATKQTLAFVKDLMEKTGASEEDCIKALNQANGDLLESQKLLEDGLVSSSDSRPTPIFDKQTLRFRALKQEEDLAANAVLILMLDVSSSMDEEKVFMIRKLFFAMLNYLMEKYQRVEKVHIIHTQTADVVDEKHFFAVSPKGGTYCFKGIELVRSVIGENYDPQTWNIYVIHFSDGQDYSDTASRSEKDKKEAFVGKSFSIGGQRTVLEAKKLLALEISLFCYGEIPYEKGPDSSVLMDAYKQGLSVTSMQKGELEIIQGVSVETPFLGIRFPTEVNDRHLVSAVKEILRQQRWIDYED